MSQVRHEPPYRGNETREVELTFPHEEGPIPAGALSEFLSLFNACYQNVTENEDIHILLTDEGSPRRYSPFSIVWTNRSYENGYLLSLRAINMDAVGYSRCTNGPNPQQSCKYTFPRPSRPRSNARRRQMDSYCRFLCNAHWLPTSSSGRARGQMVRHEAGKRRGGGTRQTLD